MGEALIYESRKIFHIKMLETNTLTMTEDGTVSNADSSSTSSKEIAKKIAEIVSENCGHKINVTNKVSGQTLGRQFEVLISEFLSDTFLNLNEIRPGKWVIKRSGFGTKTSDFAQYEHLAVLHELINENTQLAAALGNDYVIAPDIVIYRELYEDEEINRQEYIVNDTSALSSEYKEEERYPQQTMYISVLFMWYVQLA